MNGLGWVVVALLSVAVVWLGLALAGAVRELAALRERVSALEGSGAAAAGAGTGSGPVHLASGLPVGAPTPAWEMTTPDGETATSATFTGRRHLVVFADADCRACDELVPAVLRAAVDGQLPPLAVIGRGEPSATPPAWRSASARVAVGCERDGAVATAFRVDVSPHLFVIDEGGFVVAQGGADDLDGVRALLREGEGIRIVSGATDD